MNKLFLEGKIGDYIQINIEDAEHFTLQYKEDFPVKLTTNDAYEIIAFLAEFVGWETL